MSKRKAPPGTYWRDGILWGRVRFTGKPAIQQSLDTDDPKIAARRIAAIKAELTGRVKHGEARYSFSEATAAWGADLTDRVSTKTASRYLCSLGQLAPYLTDKFIDQINGALIADIIKGRKADGVTVSTVKRDLVALSSVMGFCIDEGWLEANPVLPRLGRLKERRDPIVLPDPAHIEIIVRRAPGRLADLIRAALLTGCRMDELVSAKRRTCFPIAGKSTCRCPAGGAICATVRRARLDRTTTVSSRSPSTTCVTAMPSTTSRPRCRMAAHQAFTH
jgi:integrase/recombinase XerD